MKEYNPDNTWVPVRTCALWNGFVRCTDAGFGGVSFMYLRSAMQTLSHPTGTEADRRKLEVAVDQLPAMTGFLPVRVPVVTSPNTVAHPCRLRRPF